MKKLIVNADDFGMSESINEGILESHENGIVTAATWLANGNAASAALAPESLDVGLHLALHDVSPLTDSRTFRGLLTPEGRFPKGHHSVVSWILKTPGARKTIRDEWRAQLERFQTHFGKPPTHLDSHRHIGLFPPLQSLMVEIAQEAGGVRTRTPVEISVLPSSLVFSSLGKRMKRKAVSAKLPATDAFLGYRESGHVTQKHLNNALRRVKRGVTELMVHPGSRNEPNGYYLRKSERDTLTSDETKRLIEALGILLVRPSDLA